MRTESGRNIGKFQSAMKTLAKTCNYCDDCNDSLQCDTPVTPEVRRNYGFWSKPTPADDKSSHDEHDDGVMQPKRATTGRTVGLGKASKKTPTPILTDDESSHDDGAAGAEDIAESDHQSVASQPKKTQVCTDLNEEEEEAMADWLGDHPELYIKKFNAYKDKVKKDTAWAEQAAILDKPVAFLLVWYRSVRMLLR